MLQQAIHGDATLANRRFEHACRAAELADTLVHSCRRGRTIDLHHEELTEEGTFKSIMAAGGCLALMLTFCVTLLAAALGPFAPSGNGLPSNITSTGTHWLWKLLLCGLLLFLSLQFLRLLFHRKNSASDEDEQEAAQIS